MPERITWYRTRSTGSGAGSLWFANTFRSSAFVSKSEVLSHFTTSGFPLSMGSVMTVMFDRSPVASRSCVSRILLIISQPRLDELHVRLTYHPPGGASFS
ncbi:hypothetical protein Mapa_014098 [Marchantia paleacea]|nr:hypothetical protein Mapa_014098 [Marchantia paleacea]